MRPSLNILEPELIVDRRRGEARPRRGRAWRSAGAEMRQRLLDHGLPIDATGTRVLFPRARRRGRDRFGAVSSFSLYDRDGNPHAELGGDHVHFVPGSRGLKVLDHRTGETRLADSTDFVEYVRLADGLTNIPYLATAFSTNDDIEAQVSDAWRLFMILTNSKQAGRLGRVHRARRAADGRDDVSCSAATGRTSIARPMSHLHDHRDRQLPVQRGLLPEPDRLRRGRDRGRDRAGHADGPDRAGDGRRRDGLPHGGRAGRDHDGPDRAARCAGPVRRRAGDVPHEDRQLADVGHRGAPAGRGLRRGREVAGPADPVVHGPVGRPDPRRAGGRRDVRQRAASRRWPGSTRCPAPGCWTSCWCSACRSSSSTTRCAGRRCASCARSSPHDDLPVERPGRPAAGRPAPDHGRPHDRPLADGVVPAQRDRRPRQPRGVDCGPARKDTYQRAMRRRSTDGWRATCRSRRTR